MTRDELLYLIDNDTNLEYFRSYPTLFAVLQLCLSLDEVTIGDKGLFNSGRNSMRTEIIQAIEKKLK